MGAPSNMFYMWLLVLCILQEKLVRTSVWTSYMLLNALCSQAWSRVPLSDFSHEGDFSRVYVSEGGFTGAKEDGGALRA